MIATAQTKDIVLFYPSPSLLNQVAAWAGRQVGWSLSVSTSRTAVGIRAAMSGAMVNLLDATFSPHLAMKVLELAASQFFLQTAAVYTEVMHEGLELFTRTRGALLLLGPLSGGQWEGFFAGIERAAAVRVQSALRRAPATGDTQGIYLPAETEPRRTTRH